MTGYIYIQRPKIVLKALTRDEFQDMQEYPLRVLFAV